MTSSRIMLPVKRLHISCLSPCWQHKVRLLSLWRFVSCHPSSADSGHGEHSGAEEAAHGSGHLHEDGGLLLHRHLLRSTIQRGRVAERLLLVIFFVHSWQCVFLVFLGRAVKESILIYSIVQNHWTLCCSTSQDGVIQTSHRGVLKK